jgi:hypothetical protein
MKRIITAGSLVLWLALASRPAAAQSPAPVPVAATPTAAEPAIQPAQMFQFPNLPPGQRPPQAAMAAAPAPPAAGQPGLPGAPAVASNAPEMIGDLPPSPALALFALPASLPAALAGFPPGPLGGALVTLAPPHGPGTAAGPLAGLPLVLPPDPPVRGVILVPSVSGFKVADNNTPFPTDRVYFSFNYFDNLNAAANRALGADIHNVQVYRETLGVELACLDGAASVALSAPLNTLSADSSIPGLGGTDTAFGDLTVILKYAFLRDPAGTCLSGGLAVTAPTGPSAFAGSDQIPSLHSTRLQPFLAFYCGRGDFYVQGFSSIDVPTDSRDVTVWYNDLGVGYWLLRRPDPDLVLTGLAPTLEVHVNNPLTHRGVLGFTDPAGTPDVVDLTAGLNVLLCQRARLAVGVVAPLTGPKPFDVEAITQFRVAF